MLERSRHRFELTHNPRHLKYESYSKPEADHFQLRIIWLLGIVTQPLRSVSRSMADERPLNLVQFVADYFELNFKQSVRCISTLSRD
ncbi:hypothetical protein G7B65_09605 [Lactiplantibacillus plantarum]|nr:hypothetical protein G7B65_09605 [Lactiplantibacillus plantarum]